MKTYAALFITTICFFSFKCFGQRKNTVDVTAEIANANSQLNNVSKEGLFIEGYYVEETINMPFGKRITKYEVSKLNMVNTYDLGPNNTRTVTPIYRKPKVKTAEIAGSQSKTVTNNSTTTKSVVVEVAAEPQPGGPKYIVVDVVNTYAKVLDKGYKSIDMLMKVADRSYFDGDLVLAAKYYAQLFAMTKNLDTMYYYRYAQSLKAINQPQKADEMMKIFESRNSNIKIAKQ